MPELYGLDLFGLALLSVYTMIKFVKYDSSKQPDPIQLERVRHPCVYGHPCLESREEEVDWYYLTSKKDEDEGAGEEAGGEGEEAGGEGEEAGAEGGEGGAEGEEAGAEGEGAGAEGEGAGAEGEGAGAEGDAPPEAVEGEQQVTD